MALMETSNVGLPYYDSPTFAGTGSTNLDVPTARVPTKGKSQAVGLRGEMDVLKNLAIEEGL